MPGAGGTDGEREGLASGQRTNRERILVVADQIKWAADSTGASSRSLVRAGAERDGPCRPKCELRIAAGWTRDLYAVAALKQEADRLRHSKVAVAAPPEG